MRLAAALLLLCPQDKTGPYKGWKEALFLDAPEAGVSLVCVPEIAGRIVSYGRGGENLLWENPDYLGKTLENTDPKALAQGYIGYQIDLGPELRGIPQHLPLWMGKYGVRQEGGKTVLTSADDPATGIRIVKEMALDPKTGAVSITQTMKNVSTRDQSYCFWDRTLCRGGGFAFFPVDPKTQRWGCIKDKKYDVPRHPQVKVLDGVLVVKAEGQAAKLGGDPDAGWIAYARGRQMIVKYYPVFPGGNYSDGGNTLELYWDPKVCELEPLSPEVTLKPGEEYAFPERWVLLPLDREVTTHEEARALAAKVPPNPFRK